VGGGRGSFGEREWKATKENASETRAIGSGFITGGPHCLLFKKKKSIKREIPGSVESGNALVKLIS